MLAPPIIAVVLLIAFLNEGQGGGYVSLAMVGAFTILGVFMKRYGWPRPPLVLGFILGPIIERNLQTALGFHGAVGVMTRPVTIIRDVGGRREIQLAVTHHLLASPTDEALTGAQAVVQRSPSLYEHLYFNTLNRKSIIFVNSRADAEETVMALRDLAATTGAEYERASVGLPGMVRDGVIRATPHYVTESGPFTPKRADLEKEWTGFDVRTALADALGCPTRVLNDAEVAGLAVITGKGFEVMFTLGTGLGCAMYNDGKVLPKIEMSLAPFRDGESYDQQLGHHARARIGDEVWNERVAEALDTLRPVLCWDRAYIGGGAAKHIRVDLAPEVTIVTNQSGLLGGVRLWDDERFTG
jgi:polyphosphate glucokinase